MPQPVRHVLAQKYIGGRGPQDDEKFAASLLNAINTEQNFLVRPFIGRRRLPPSARPMRNFSLRNFPLHLDQIEELGLPVNDYAMAMADTLAFLHWGAVVDGKDVEFVLARPRSPLLQSSSSARPAQIGSEPFSSEGVCGEHAMWLLDFDLCNKMAMPGAMVMSDGGETAQTETAFLEAAAAGFWGNDPWYPRPLLGRHTNGNGNGDGNNSNDNHDAGSEHHLADGQLWKKFKGRYLETSQQILEGKEEGEEQMEKEWPGRVMDLIERMRWSNGGKLVYLEENGRVTALVDD